VLTHSYNIDLAISASYLRGGDPAVEEAMLAGYAEVAPLPEVVPAVLVPVLAATCWLETGRFAHAVPVA
jgi:Ser/Thr protein kinase RdoA (MazF antagonist)